jgi:uncharacterized membrane protein YvlD (DUF360 family)
MILCPSPANALPVTLIAKGLYMIPFNLIYAALVVWITKKIITKDAWYCGSLWGMLFIGPTCESLVHVLFYAACR